MNRNHLKIIACISMLIDHIGFVLFPHIEILRLIGRIAMPIFAFFIGEGCLYTKDRKKYFLRVFVLGIICQAVYIAESIITHSDGWAYLNILLTFSVSIAVCASFLFAAEKLKSPYTLQKIKGVCFFISVLLLVAVLELFCKNSYRLTGISFYFDYGICGMLLPLSAAVSKNKKIKLISFSTALVLCVLSLYSDTANRLCALIPVILLCFYNGNSGRKNLKYFFYAFYPCHLAAIYLIDLIF